MQVNRIAQTTSVAYKPSFKAMVPKSLQEELFNEALRKKTKQTGELFDQIKKVADWGHETCSITKVTEKTKEGEVHSLALIDSYVAPFQKAPLPKKQTLLDSFLALTEKIVVNAENTFKL